MAEVLSFLILTILVFTVNVVPAFMPATWMVLVFVYIQYKLPILPLLIVGVIASTLGRVVLYYISAHFFKHILPESSQENMLGLGKLINRKKHVFLPLILVFAAPVPSNHFFIGSGFAKLDIKLLSLTFFLGRAINYSFLVGSSGLVATNLQGFLQPTYTAVATIVLEIAGFGILFLLTKIGWEKILAKFI